GVLAHKPRHVATRHQHAQRYGRVAVRVRAAIDGLHRTHLPAVHLLELAYRRRTPSARRTAYAARVALHLRGGPAAWTHRPAVVRSVGRRQQTQPTRALLLRTGAAGAGFGRVAPGTGRGVVVQ